MTPLRDAIRRRTLARIEYWADRVEPDDSVPVEPPQQARRARTPSGVLRPSKEKAPSAPPAARRKP